MMIPNLSNIRLEAVAVNKKGWPSGDIPEVAFAGRSNVGKSSVINMLTNRKKLAYVGKTPGKTRTVNFYNIDDKVRFVDLPGYGYAVASKGKEQKWADFVNSYLTKREQLALVVHLIDARHKPNANDLQMNMWLNQTGIQYIICLTKTDKLNNKDRHSAMKTLIERLELSGDTWMIETSALKKRGQKELLDYIFSNISGDDDINTST